MSAFGRAKLAQYQSVSVHGGVSQAHPHALVLMLMDGAAERLSIARGCIERGEISRQSGLLHSCVRLIAELRGSLNMEKGGAIAQNLNNLYEYMTRRVIHANAFSDVRAIVEVQSLLAEIRGAWAAIGTEVRQSAPAETSGSWSAGPAPGAPPAAQTKLGSASR